MIRMSRLSNPNNDQPLMGLWIALTCHVGPRIRCSWAYAFDHACRPEF